MFLQGNYPSLGSPKPLCHIYRITLSRLFRESDCDEKTNICCSYWSNIQNLCSNHTLAL